MRHPRAFPVIAWPRWAGRRGPLVAEIAVLAVLVVVDGVFEVRAGSARGLLGSIAVETAPGVGPTVAVLAVLRRRFSDRSALLGCCVAALSLLGTGLSVLAAAVGEGLPAQPAATETVALALLVGTACHRLAPRPAAGMAGLGVLAMVAAPVLRYGPGSPAALLAVPAALLWGGSVAVGLILRDADARRQAALAAAQAQVRTDERLRMARELHDLVAHHITGVVVRAQAARVIANRRSGPADNLPEPVFAEIEQAAAEALAAMRRLVGMLRTDQDELASAPTGVADAVHRAVPADDTVRLAMPAVVQDLAVTPETASAVHRLVMEALTNRRRHAPRATDVQVDLRVEREREQNWLVVEVRNNGVEKASAERGPGYGLVGMTERVTALGGTVHAGAEPGARWRVTARLPVGPDGASP